MKGSFWAIRITSRAEFEGFVEHLTDEAFHIRDHWEVWGALAEAFNRHPVEMYHTPNYWKLTLRAHMDSVVLRLGRLFDPHPSAISLGNLLQTMKENAVNPHTPLPSAVANLAISELDQAMTSVSDCDATVKKLFIWRNEYLAHRGSRHIAGGTYASLPPLERADLEMLLNRALDILAKYRERLGFHLRSWGPDEVEEFKTLLALLRTGLRVSRDGGYGIGGRE